MSRRKGQRETERGSLETYIVRIVFFEHSQECRVVGSAVKVIHFLILFRLLYELFRMYVENTRISMLYHNACLPLKDTMCFMCALCFSFSCSLARCVQVYDGWYIREDIVYLLCV